MTGNITGNFVRRVLTIDDNDAIHADFRKILVGSAPSTEKLQSAKAKLFGGAKEAAPTTSKVTFEVDSALQGQEGYEKLRAAMKEGKPYAVAFVDMRMPPGWDGLQTIQRLWEEDADLQVVICSAFSDYSWEEISEKLGLTDRLLILKKPFDPAEVIQLATALSEKWELRRMAKLRMDELEQMVAQRTAELTHMAMFDKLTGLGNRALMLEQLTKSVERAKADPNYGFALLYLDFDRFKLINDSLGHESGDLVLKGIAERIKAALQLAGTVVGDAVAARLGGDEFAILMDGVFPACGGNLDASGFAQTLLRLLATPYHLSGRDVHCTASIGITLSILKYASATDAIRDADTAMYNAKAAGKARYVMFDRAMHEEIMQRLMMENQLRVAVDRGEMKLEYQPIVSLATGKTKGFEALVRWNHPQRGIISPLDFIPLSEEIGIIHPMGTWILLEACTQLAKWQASDPEFRELQMSVNLSPKQLLDPMMPQFVAEVLARTKVDPKTLCLEITESVMMVDPQAAIDALARIRAMGVRLFLDDFGTGYSSLSILHQLPLNGIKIDRSFIHNASERREYSAVVNAIITLAQHLNMEMVAEGIENGDQVALLQAMYCDLAQGFHFSKPLGVEEAEAFLRTPFRPVQLAA